MTRGWMVKREELIDVMVGEGFLVEDCNSGRSDYADDFGEVIGAEMRPVVTVK